MNPQQELSNHIKVCYELLKQLEAKELSNNIELARKDQMIETQRLDALSLLEAQELSNNIEIERRDQLIDTLRIDVSVLCNDLDDVRMAYCSLLASYSVTLGVKQDAQAIAKSFGWSCYDRGYQ